MENIKSILLDIEGTTTSISFVKNILFLYIKQNLMTFLTDNWNDPTIKAIIMTLQHQSEQDVRAKVEGVIPIPAIEKDGTIQSFEVLYKNIRWLMSRDSKLTCLKELQGHILEPPYLNGKIVGHVYEDVPNALEEWTKAGKKCYIYSSGSVKAQKLLFGHTSFGDLTKYISGFFDTVYGDKKNKESYVKIFGEISTLPNSILFLTDSPEEAEAAKAAGAISVLVARKGNEPVAQHYLTRYPSIVDFSELEKIPLTKENV